MKNYEGLSNSETLTTVVRANSYAVDLRTVSARGATLTCRAFEMKIIPLNNKILKR